LRPDILGHVVDVRITAVGKFFMVGELLDDTERPALPTAILPAAVTAAAAAAAPQGHGGFDARYPQLSIQICLLGCPALYLPWLRPRLSRISGVGVKLLRICMYFSTPWKLGIEVMK
jgi:hypothetical protein